MAKAAKHEMVAFVTDDGSLDHGVALAGTDDQVRVLSMARHIPVVASYDNVVSISAFKVPASLDKQITAALTSEEKKVAADYWRKLYSYAPEYAAQLVEFTNAGTVL